jgi:hypothetical protein
MCVHLPSCQSSTCPSVLLYSHAHPDRTQRVKAARSEAQKEIEDYRKQKEEEFQRFEKEVRTQATYTYLWAGINPAAANFRQQSRRRASGEGHAEAARRDPGDRQEDRAQGGR